MSDSSVTPSQIAQALNRIWDISTVKTFPMDSITLPMDRQKMLSHRRDTEYTEGHHIERKPSEVVELYQGLDPDGPGTPYG